MATISSSTRTFMIVNNVSHENYLKFKQPSYSVKNESKSSKSFTDYEQKSFSEISSTNFPEKLQSLENSSVIEKLHILDCEKKIKDEIYDKLLASIDVINLSIIELNDSIDTILFEIQKQISLHDSSDCIVLNSIFDISEDEDDFINITSIAEENKKKPKIIFQMIVENYCKSAMSLVS